VPFGAEISFANEDAGKGWAMDAHSAVTKAAEEAMAEAFNTEPINKGEGGSIPFIPELQKLFPGAKVLVTGPEDPQSNAHSPNESISLSGLKNNIVTEALLLARLANIDLD
jgi:acetylornithine deacetylase/succinyl-diaminopimelate desuccinylase-like protein